MITPADRDFAIAFLDRLISSYLSVFQLISSFFFPVFPGLGYRLPPRAFSFTPFIDFLDQSPMFQRVASHALQDGIFLRFSRGLLTLFFSKASLPDMQLVLI